MTESLQPEGPAGASVVPMPRPGGRWRPGESGNISGRPKGLVAAVQEKAGKDGNKLVEGLWLLAYGTPAAREAHFGEAVSVSTKDRLLAISQLLDRGWGRAPMLLGVETGPSLRSGPRNLDSGLSEISIVFQAAVPKPVAPKYTTSGVRRPSEL